MSIGAPASRAVEAGHGDVLRDRSLWQQGLEAVGRHEHDALPGWRRTDASPASGSPLTSIVAGGRALLPGEHREELVLALALERRDPEDLARVQREGDVRERLADAHAANLECPRDIGGDLDPLALRRRLGTLGRLGDLGPEHELDDLLLAALRRHERADVGAVAEHGRPVAVRDHLPQAVGDEESRPASLLLSLHHREDALGEIGRQRGRDLVQDQQLRVARKRPREVEHPEHGQRQVERLLGEVDVEIEVVQVPPDRIDRRAGQPQVLLDGQVGHERRILEDGRETDVRRLRGRGDADSAAVHEDRARIRPDHARQHLDERALAGAVRAEQRMDLARLDDERRRGERDDRAVALRRPRVRPGGSSARWEEGAPEAPPPPSVVRVPYGPLQPVSCAAVYVVHGLMNSCELYVGGRFGE